MKTKEVPSIVAKQCMQRNGASSYQRTPWTWITSHFDSAIHLRSQLSFLVCTTNYMRYSYGCGSLSNVERRWTQPIAFAMRDESPKEQTLIHIHSSLLWEYYRYLHTYLELGFRCDATHAAGENRDANPYLTRSRRSNRPAWEKSMNFISLSNLASYKG
jgi:hypothetical protein